MLTDYDCQCDYCLKLTKENLEHARKEWANGKREIIFKPYHYSCSDGCCDEYGTKVYINGFELPCDERDTGHVLENVFEFLQINGVMVNWDHDGEE